MRYSYKTSGVCSRSITFEVENGIVSSVSYEGGCNGNLQGISRLVEGKTVDEVIAALSGIRCGYKDTSCPDQLTRALLQVKNQQDGE